MVVDFIAKLREARSAPRTVITRVRADYSSHDLTWHAFFEGQDDQSFYMTFIDRYKPPRARVFTYQCGGKGKVHDISGELAAAAYDRARMLFFVDKDLEDLLGEHWERDDAFFVTEWYSIENYITCADALSRTVRELLRIDLNAEEEATIVEQFRTGLRQYHEMLLLLCAWVWQVRELGVPANLSNVDMGRLIEVDETLSPRVKVGGHKAGLAYLERATGAVVPRPAYRGITSKARQLRALQPKIYLRGKFELWFFVECVRRLARVLRELPGPRVRARTSLNHSNAVDQLGPRTPEPEALTRYLSTRRAS